MAGHVALSLLPGLAGVGVGLVLIALGSGGVKANATSLVGSLYAEHDTRRDAGFSLFYMGINIGALIGPLLTGLLQKDAGLPLRASALAAVGMALGPDAVRARPRASCPRRPAHVVPDPLPAGRADPATPRAAVVVRRRRRPCSPGSGVITAGRLSNIVIGISLRRRDRLLRADPAPTATSRGAERQPGLRVHPDVRLQRRSSGRSTSSSSPW